MAQVVEPEVRDIGFFQNFPPMGLPALDAEGVTVPSTSNDLALCTSPTAEEGKDMDCVITFFVGED